MADVRGDVLCCHFDLRKFYTLLFFVCLLYINCSVSFVFVHLVLSLFSGLFTCPPPLPLIPKVLFPFYIWLKRREPGLEPRYSCCFSALSILATRINQSVSVAENYNFSFHVQWLSLSLRLPRLCQLLPRRWTSWEMAVSTSILLFYVFTRHYYF